jgi:flagellar hook-associated protein 2
MTSVSSTSSSTGTTSSTASTSSTSSTSSSSSTTSTGSATTALLTSLGVSGNIDATGLADELSTAEYSGQIDQLNSQNTKLTTQISDESTLMNMVSSLSSSLNTLITGGSLASTPQIANSQVATVSAGTTTGSGSSTLEVDSLAQGETLASPTISSTATSVGSGTLTLTFGTVSGSTFTAGSQSPVTITVAQGASLSDVATDINNAGAGVTAYVASNSNGQQLVITGPQGATNAFTISASENASDPGLSQFAWSPSTSSSSSSSSGSTSNSGATLAASATDASYILNGVQRTSSTNSITNAAPGISLNLTGTNVGAPTTISFTDPTSAIGTAMNDLVTALNTIVSQLNTYTAQGGDLNNDPGANSLRQALSSLTSTTIMPNAASGAPATLGDLGLEINEDGTYTLDSSTLNTAIANNPTGVAAMFTTGASGVYATIFDLSLSVNDSTNPNSLAGSSATMKTKQTAIASQLSKIAAEQSALRTQLLTQFSALNSTVTAYKSTQSFLTQQIALWTNSSSTSSSG